MYIWLAILDDLFEAVNGDRDGDHCTAGGGGGGGDGDAADAELHSSSISQSSQGRDFLKQGEHSICLLLSANHGVAYRFYTP